MEAGGSQGESGGLGPPGKEKGLRWKRSYSQGTQGLRPVAEPYLHTHSLACVWWKHARGLAGRLADVVCSLQHQGFWAAWFTQGSAVPQLKAHFLNYMLGPWLGQPGGSRRPGCYFQGQFPASGAPGDLSSYRLPGSCGAEHVHSPLWSGNVCAPRGPKARPPGLLSAGFCFFKTQRWRLHCSQSMDRLFRLGFHVHLSSQLCDFGQVT